MTCQFSFTVTADILLNKTTIKTLFHSETAVGEGFWHSRWDRGRGGGRGGGFDINRPCLTCLGSRYASVIDFTVGWLRLTCPFSPQPTTLDMTCTIYLWPLPPMVDEEFRYMFCVCTVIDFTVERIRLTCLFSAQLITMDMTHVPAVDEEFWYLFLCTVWNWGCNPVDGPCLTCLEVQRLVYQFQTKPIARWRNHQLKGGCGFEQFHWRHEVCAQLLLSRTVHSEVYINIKRQQTCCKIWLATCDNKGYGVGEICIPSPDFQLSKTRLLLYPLYGHTYSKSMDQTGKVTSPARGQLNRKNE